MNIAMNRRYHVSQPVKAVRRPISTTWLICGVIAIAALVISLASAFANAAINAWSQDTGIVEYLQSLDDETKSDDMMSLLISHTCADGNAPADVCGDKPLVEQDQKPPSTIADQGQVLATAKAIQRAAKQLSDREAVTFANLIHLNGEKYSINPKLLLGIISVESRFNPRAHSKHGAKGLMQVMHRIHRDKLRGRDPYRADVSVEVGSRIFKDCMTANRGNVRRALTCYNGGGRKYAALVLSAVHRLSGWM
jgi:soluble lytic murein transglycosylase-like protein